MSGNDVLSRDSITKHFQTIKINVCIESQLVIRVEFLIPYSNKEYGKVPYCLFSREKRTV